MKITFLVGYNVLGVRLWFRKLNGLKKRRVIRLIKNEKNIRELSSRVACTTDGSKLLVKSVVRNSAEIHVLGPHLCTRIWVGAMIDLLKKPLSICQSGWRQIRNVLPLSPLGAQSKDLGAAASQKLLDVASRGKITSATQATSRVA